MPNSWIAIKLNHIHTRRNLYTSIWCGGLVVSELPYLYKMIARCFVTIYVDLFIRYFFGRAAIATFRSKMLMRHQAEDHSSAFHTRCCRRCRALLSVNHFKVFGHNIRNNITQKCRSSVRAWGEDNSTQPNGVSIFPIFYNEFRV